jgi:hypothetical protein
MYEGSLDGTGLRDIMRDYLLPNGDGTLRRRCGMVAAA